MVPPVGQVFECPPGSTPDEPGPVDQARPQGCRRGWGAMAFDRRRAGWWPSRATSRRRDVDVRRVHEHLDADASQPRAAEPWTGVLVYDVDSDVTIVSDGTRTWVYDLEANTWTEQGDRPRSRRVTLTSAIRFYDPVSGHVVAGEDGDIPPSA